MSMPVIFVGHGSPMNAIETNAYTQEWRAIGKKIKPKAILMVSAHWFTRGLYTQDTELPEIINDMYGFPRELYEVNYQVHGNQELTQAILNRVSQKVQIQNDWGIDHGAWSVLNHMYPNKDVPVVQLSVDATGNPENYVRIGRELQALRDEDVLIIGSGNIVHNLRMVDFHQAGGYDWAYSFDAKVKEAILSGHDDRLLQDYATTMPEARLAVPTTEHFDPLFYILGARTPEDRVTVFNEDCTMGSMSMTGYIFEK